jgi:hypothetical protein
MILFQLGRQQLEALQNGKMCDLPDRTMIAIL